MAGDAMSKEGYGWFLFGSAVVGILVFVIHCCYYEFRDKN